MTRQEIVARESWMPSDESIKGAFERWYSITLATGPDERDSPELAPIRALIAAAVEKALAEYDFRSSRDFFEWKKQEDARHKRELIQAGIDELNGPGGVCRCGIFTCNNCRRIAELEAKLAALEPKGGEG